MIGERVCTVICHTPGSITGGARKRGTATKVTTARQRERMQPSFRRMTSPLFTRFRVDTTYTCRPSRLLVPIRDGSGSLVLGVTVVAFSLPSSCMIHGGEHFHSQEER